jgi:hypothetical protein
VALEPVCEGDVVQGADVAHAALGVKQGAHNGGGAQGQRVGNLVREVELHKVAGGAAGGAA